jgi:hypothetical protein
MRHGWVADANVEQSTSLELRRWVCLMLLAYRMIGSQHSTRLAALSLAFPMLRPFVMPYHAISLVLPPCTCPTFTAAALRQIKPDAAATHCSIAMQFYAMRGLPAASTRSGCACGNCCMVYGPGTVTPLQRWVAGCGRVGATLGGSKGQMPWKVG